MLSKLALYHLSHVSSHCGSGYFADGVSLFVQASPGSHQFSYFILPTIAGMTDARHHSQLFSVEMGSHERFCTGWPETIILLITVSQVVRITSSALARVTLPA